MESEKYWHKIKEWHEKAKNEKDHFLKFILKYISFIAYLSMNYERKKNDRRLIQKFKRETEIKKKLLIKLTNKLFMN